jgi:hypothetical protein
MREASELSTQNTREAFDILAEHIDEKAYVGKSGTFTFSCIQLITRLTSEVSICVSGQ